MKKNLRRLWRRHRGEAARSELSSPSREFGQTIFSTDTAEPESHFRNLTLAAPDEAEAPVVAETQFKIRLAKAAGARRDAGQLVNRRYSDRGYLLSSTPDDPQLFSFVAYDDGQPVGTVSIRLDSERGLSADTLYKAELDAWRKRGCRMCEFTRLAVDVSTASKPVLASLFHTAYLYAALVRGYDHAVIEVNPRHAPFYRRALGFKRIGPQRLNTRVNAPAVLLCVPFERIAAGVAAFGGKGKEAAGERSLYPYGFSPQEEQGILGRLRDLDLTRRGSDRPQR